MFKKTNLIVAALLLFAVLAGIGFALTPPPPPPPPVNQNIGLFDTSIEKLGTNATDQSNCRSCHQSSGTNVSSSGYNNTLGGVDTRHHNLVAEANVGITNPLTNGAFGCQDCHPTITSGNGVLLDHSCQDCHNGTSFWADSSLGARVGNFSRPHHVNTTYDDAKVGNPAANRTCNLCHGSFVDNFNDGHYVPTYASNFTGGTMMVSTNPVATWKITSNVPNPIPVFDSGNSLVANKTWGGCESCHDANPAATPFAIGSNHDNHHKEILGFARFGGTTPFQNASTPFNVTNACSVCHVIDEANITGHGNTFPLRINIVNSNTGETLSNLMEVRNSTIEQADIPGAVEFSSANGTITVNGTGCEKCHDVKSIHNIQFNYVQNGQQGLGHINNNADCYGCHNSWLPADTWIPGPLVPYIDSVSPSVIPSNTAGTITITGSNFVNPDGQYTSVVTVDGVTYTPLPGSETATQISVNLPALPAGIHQLQLVKGGDTLSKLYTLTAVSNPTITSVVFAPGKNGGPGTITVNGNGFGVKPATNSQYYVSANHAGTQITTQTIQRWSNTQITAKISGVASGDTVTVMTTATGEAQANIQ